MPGISELLIVVVMIAIFFFFTKKTISKESVDEMGDQIIAEIRFNDGFINELPDVYDRIMMEFFEVGSPTISKVQIHLLSMGDDINAGAIAGGHIVVGGGLHRMFSEGDLTVDELAGVLAHEIGHLVLEHNLKQTIQRDRANFLSQTFQNPLASIFSKIITADNNQKDELAADEFATNLLAKSAFATSGLLTFLQKTIDETQFPHWAELFTDHPHTEVRIMRLKEVLSRV